MCVYRPLYKHLIDVSLSFPILTHNALFLLLTAQMCGTWRNIAYVHEEAGHDYEEIKESYFKALEYAELSGKPQAVVGFIIYLLECTFLLKIFLDSK